MNRSTHLAGLLSIVLTAGPAVAAPPVGLRLIYEVHTEEVVRPEMPPEEARKAREAALEQTLQTTHNRLQETGASDPVVEAAPGDRMVVRLPTVDDPDRIKRVIGERAVLEFRLVRYPKGGGGVSSREEILANFGEQLPDGLEILEGDKGGAADPGKLYYAVEKQPVVTGQDFKNARSGLGQFGQPIVEFTLEPAAAEVFGKATGENVGSGLAIVLNGRVVSAPVINSRIGDRGVIEGNFTQEEVEDLVLVLRTGSLPVSIALAEEKILPAAKTKPGWGTIGLWAVGLLYLGFAVFYLIYRRRARSRV